MRKKTPVFDFKKAINLEYPTSYYIALILGLFFLILSFNKLMAPGAFASTLFHGHLVPYPLVNMTALLLMSLEFVAAFAVVFVAKYRRAGLWILVAVSVACAGGVGVNLLRDLNTACGCFGSDPRAAAISHWSLVGNLVPVIAGLFALR
jgi:hypothetical protein